VSVWRDEPLSIADDLFLISLDERTGRTRLHQRALSVGVAGGLVAELVLHGLIRWDGTRFAVTRTGAAPPRQHHEAMLAQIAAEPQHELTVWLAFFAQTAADTVADSLVERGFLTAQTSRVLVRTRTSWQATDTSALAWRSLRLANLIAKRDVRNWQDGVLVALVAATGLSDHVLWHGSPADATSLREIVAGVAEDPFFHQLTAQVSAQIAAGVITQRK